TTKEMDAVFRVPEDSDNKTILDTNEPPTENGDTDSEPYDTASEGETELDPIGDSQINQGTSPNTDNDTLFEDNSQPIDLLLPQEYSRSEYKSAFIKDQSILGDRHFVDAVIEKVVIPNKEWYTSTEKDKYVKDTIRKYQLRENQHQDFDFKDGLAKGFCQGVLPRVNPRLTRPIDYFVHTILQDPDSLASATATELAQLMQELLFSFYIPCHPGTRRRGLLLNMWARFKNGKKQPTSTKDQKGEDIAIDKEIVPNSSIHNLPNPTSQIPEHSPDLNSNNFENTRSRSFDQQGQGRRTE
ncbi:hypothetical protein BB560_005665, partial [Smittium megazygosporum]